MDAQTNRVASRYFEERYAKLLVSMSVQEAKHILGFPPYYSPTETEISKAWRAKAFEHHPDRGGDLQTMVEINVAKDILQGKRTEQWRPEPPPPPPPRPKPEPPKVIDFVKGQSWNSAAEFPSGVDWKFVSKPTWAGKAKDRNASGGYIWVVVGIKDDKFVATALKYRKADQLWDHEKGGLVDYEADWRCNVSIVPMNRPAIKVIPSLIKGVSLMWDDGSVGEPPKKYMLWPQGDKLTEETIQRVKWGGGGIPLKDVLVGSGMVAESTKGVSGRKTQVEMRFQYDKTKKERFRKEFPGKSSVLWSYNVFVSVNGKEAQLTDETILNLERGFFGFTISWDDVQDGRVRNLTRLRGGMFRGGAGYTLRKLADALTSEPSWFIIAVEKAAEEWEAEEKTASLFRIASEVPLQVVAEAFGMTLFDLNHALMAG